MFSAIGDFNEDGRPDLALSIGYTYNSGSVLVLLNSGEGTFAGLGGLVVGDVNGDGLPDVTKLGLARTSDGAVLTWPSYTAGLMLESTESLAAPDWRRVAAPVSMVGDHYLVTNATTRSTQFFRLRRQ